jgi:vanillate monooxygenase ferredoxin subunit
MSNVTTNRAFRVDLPEHDLSFDVAPDQTIVQVARDHGIEILTACEDGQCGTCIVKVLEGEPDHRDRALEPEKQREGWMCACVSRARGTHLSLEIW